jgi:asparagine synthase (glutamine-hydrolysing)
LRTDHHELYVQPAEAQEVLPDLADWYDEPFADSSQIPTYLVSRLARTKVTVALSGDGGDELFAGYNRYTRGYAAWRRFALLPPPLRRPLGRALKARSPAFWDTLARPIPPRLRPNNVGDRVHRLADLLDAATADDFYLRLVSLWDDPVALVPGAREPELRPWESGCTPAGVGAIESMQATDTVRYLPDDILTKVDRASMAVGLEARVPLLDHRLVEFAWTLPLQAKIRNGTGKWLLRQVLYRHVPPALVERPKMGFGVPIGAWLRGPLRDWAESLLSAAALADGGLAPAPIRQRWAEHLAGRRNWQEPLWGVLMYQAWRERWRVG